MEHTHSPESGHAGRRAAGRGHERNREAVPRLLRSRAHEGEELLPRRPHSRLCARGDDDARREDARGQRPRRQGARGAAHVPGGHGARVQADRAGLRRAARSWPTTASSRSTPTTGSSSSSSATDSGSSPTAAVLGGLVGDLKEVRDRHRGEHRRAEAGGARGEQEPGVERRPTPTARGSRGTRAAPPAPAGARCRADAPRARPGRPCPRAR